MLRCHLVRERPEVLEALPGVVIDLDAEGRRESQKRARGNVDGAHVLDHAAALVFRHGAYLLRLRGGGEGLALLQIGPMAESMFLLDICLSVAEACRRDAKYLESGVARSHYFQCHHDSHCWCSELIRAPAHRSDLPSLRILRALLSTSSQ